jgi:branched-chain amino acid transport system substrate-binding protein
MNASLLRLVLTVALVLGTAVPLPAADPYEINVILSSSGPAGLVGQSESATLTKLEARVNRDGGIGGRPIKFVFHDDTSNPQVAVQLTNSLITKNVPLILGPALGAMCAAVEPLVEKAGPLVYCFSNVVKPPPNSYMFSTMMTASDFVAVGLRFQRLSGRKRFALIATTDATGQDGERSADAYLARPEAAGMTLVAREHFGITDISVAAQLARVKAANPDFIMVWATGTPAGTALRGMKDLGLDTVPVFMANTTYAQMEQYASFLPQSLYCPVSAALAPEFVTDRATRAADQYLTQTIAGKADAFDIAAWDPTLIVLEALRKLGTNATAAQLRSYIANLKGFTAASGHYDFTAIPQRGIGESEAYIVRWDPSRTVWVAVSKSGGAPR